MKQSQPKSRKFTGIRLLLLLVAVGILGATGWYVWHMKNQSAPTKSQPAVVKSSTPTATTTKPAAEPLADWIEYINTKGVYKFKHPKAWAAADHPELCNDGLVLFGANSASVGTCGSENRGQILVLATDGDHRTEFAFSESNYSNIKKSEVAGDGVHGTRYEGTAYSPGDAGALTAYPNGTKVVEYVLYAANGKTYTATYTQASGYPDVLGDFDIMVSKTMTFNL